MQPWGVWRGNSLHLPSRQVQSSPPPHTNCPLEALEAALQLQPLTTFLGSQVLMSPQAASSPSLCTQSSPHHCTWLCAGTGDTDMSQTQFLLSKEPLFLISAPRCDSPALFLAPQATAESERPWGSVEEEERHSLIPGEGSDGGVQKPWV